MGFAVNLLGAVLIVSALRAILQSQEHQRALFMIILSMMTQLSNYS